MYKYNCNDFDPIIEKCKGCDFISVRITDKVEYCRYSFHPATEWFGDIICPRATHVLKDDKDFFGEI